MDSVVVAFGAHENSASAVRWAADLATLAKIPLGVVSAYETEFAERSPELFDEQVVARRGRIDSILSDTGVADAEVDIVKNPEPFDAMAEHLHERKGSLGVIGSEDSHGLGGFGSGRPALHLLHRTHHPVAVIRPDYEPIEGGVFVVGVDGSEANAAALRFSERIALSASGSIHAVFAYDPMDDTFTLPEGWHRHSDDVRAEVAKVNSVPTKLYMAAGHPSGVLIEHAQKEKAAAIVVGTRGRGGFGGLILGRVPSQLIAHATSTVVVVPE